MKHSFCEDWEFTRHWTEAFGKGLPVPKQEIVLAMAKSYVIAFMIALQKKQNTLYLQVKILSASSVFLSSTSVSL